MKKVFAIVLVLMTVLSFSACRESKLSMQTGDSNTQTTDKSSAGTQEQHNGSITDTSSCIHIWGQWNEKESATCSQSGTQTRECTNCSDVEFRSIEITPHENSEWIIDTAASANKEGKKHIECIYCKKIIEKQAIPKINEEHKHEGTSYVVTKQPTCKSKGSMDLICSCGAVVKTDIIDSTEHNVVIDKAVVATCTQNGLTEGRHCSVCETILQEQRIIPMVAHEYNNDVCVCGLKRFSEGLSFTLNDNAYYVSGIGSCADTSVIIPETYNGKEVRGITEKAFINNTTIEEVYIPDTVRYVGNRAFFNATNIESVRLSNNLERLYDEVFSQCRNLKEITIPNNMGQIGIRSFSGCTSLKKVNMSNVIHIRSEAFAGCSSLTSLTLPTSLRRIESGAFNDCGFDEITYRGPSSMFYGIERGWCWCNANSILIRCTDPDMNIMYFCHEGKYELFPKR